MPQKGTPFAARCFHICQGKSAQHYFACRMGAGRAPFRGAWGVRMKRRHMFRRRFFFACGWRLASHQWTMAERERGEKMHVRGARLALTMRCLGAAGGKRTEREDGEPAKSSRGGVRPQHNSEGPSGHWNDTVQRTVPAVCYILYGADSKRGCARYLCDVSPPQPLKRPWRKRQRRAASLARSQPGLGRQPQRLKADRPNSAR